MTVEPQIEHSDGGVLTTPEIHPLALLIPEMEPDQYADLRDDIAKHGLNMPIVLHEQKVLDGRHRLRACGETGTQPRFEDFEGDSAVEFVLSMNVKRRHLTVSQRAAIAMAFLPAAEDEARQRQGTRTDLVTSGSPDPEVPPRRAREDVGRMAGVSGATIDRARRVAQEDPEMFEQVKAGAISVREADDTIRERKRPTNGTGPTHVGNRWNRTATELVENVVKNLTGIPLALNEIDTTAAIKDPSAPLEDWDRKLTTVIRALSQLRGGIRKELEQ